MLPLPILTLQEWLRVSLFYSSRDREVSLTRRETGLFYPTVVGPNGKTNSVREERLVDVSGVYGSRKACRSSHASGLGAGGISSFKPIQKVMSLCLDATALERRRHPEYHRNGCGSCNREAVERLAKATHHSDLLHHRLVPVCQVWSPLLREDFFIKLYM